jgi:hypothetical protein
MWHGLDFWRHARELRNCGAIAARSLIFGRSVCGQRCVPEPLASMQATGGWRFKIRRLDVAAEVIRCMFFGQKVRDIAPVPKL